MKDFYVSHEKLAEIAKQYPTPFYNYDEKGIRENMERVTRACAWNTG